MNEKAGTLYIVATPIGNLDDITRRAIDVLGSVDLVACEDTRHSHILLSNYGIKTPTTSYHEHNKYEKAEVLLDKLRSGKNIALISDAGTPAISDPGEVLVKMCKDEEIEVTSIPGPSAVITALTLSGFSTRRFIFEGFLPTDKTELKEVLSSLVDEVRTTVIYEAPHRLKKTLKLLLDNIGDRNICLAREMTKVHEEASVMRISEAISYYEDNEARGEFVLVIEGADKSDVIKKSREEFESMDIEEHLQMYLDMGLDKKEAMKKVASDRGISKRDVYSKLI